MSDSPTPPTRVILYTDGGCSPNPGPGGWGVVILADEAAKRPLRELSGVEETATNNRMEMRAALEGLRALEQSCEVLLITDSVYLKRGVEEWLAQWQQKGWKTQGKEDVKNRDLWEALAEELKRHRVNWRWTKGHAGDKWNERADHLASSPLRQRSLPLDDQAAVHVFTAAAFSGKTQRGGFGAVLRFGEHHKELSGAVDATSANRMHIQAAIEGLRALKREVTTHVYTSSDYVCEGATRWLKQWQANQWLTREKQPVSHQDLWQALDLLQQRFEVHWHVIPRDDPHPELMIKAKALATAAVQNVVQSEPAPPPPPEPAGGPPV